MLLLVNDALHYVLAVGVVTNRDNASRRRFFVHDPLRANTSDLTNYARTDEWDDSEILEYLAVNTPPNTWVYDIANSTNTNPSTIIGRFQKGDY